MRDRLDRALAALARFVAAVFFRRIEILGAARIPGAGPLVVVANHQNGLVDPVLLLAALPRPVRFLAKSTLWKIPVLSSILDLAGSIPVFRREDAGADTSRNLATFARCHELLAGGGALALFPEGTSHDRPALQPLRTGAARIALEAEARCGPLGVRIVPVGLLFEEKTRFRSRALVVVGEPIAVAAGKARDEAAAARELTAAVAEGLRRVTLNFGSWDQARLVDRAAELFAGEEEGPSLAAEFGRQQALLAGSDELAARHPERLAALAVRRDPNQVATYKLFPSLLLYPATWTGEALLAGHFLGGHGAVLALFAAPMTGWVALRYLEEQQRLRREVRAFLLLRTRRSLHALLRGRREAIRSELQALAREASAASAARSSSRSTS